MRCPCGSWPCCDGCEYPTLYGSSCSKPGGGGRMSCWRAAPNCTSCGGWLPTRCAAPAADRRTASPMVDGLLCMPNGAATGVERSASSSSAKLPSRPAGRQGPPEDASGLLTSWERSREAVSALQRLASSGKRGTQVGSRRKTQMINCSSPCDMPRRSHCKRQLPSMSKVLRLPDRAFRESRAQNRLAWEGSCISGDGGAAESALPGPTIMYTTSASTERIRFHS
mmetsp:Transcript_22619/g.71136  ORF Transcript_22619/g.71136 Transcript_22619/m.71136 type:complete len:225 (+) Transcript_22619:85-759(+)